MKQEGNNYCYNNRRYEEVKCFALSFINLNSFEHLTDLGMHSLGHPEKHHKDGLGGECEWHGSTKFLKGEMDGKECHNFERKSLYKIFEAELEQRRHKCWQRFQCSLIPFYPRLVIWLILNKTLKKTLISSTFAA